MVSAGRLLMLGGGRRLPYDAEVTYLESTGTQWIDTGVLPDNNTQTDIDFMVLRNNTAYDCVAACEGNSVFYWVCARNGGNDRYMLNTSNSGAVFVSRAFNVRHRVQFNASGNKLILDGVAYQLGSVAKRCPNTIGLWAEHFHSHAAYFSIARIYSAVIIDRSTGVTLRDLIPVRFANEQGVSEGAMYDKVTGKLFRNQGTGAFTFGPDTGLTARSYIQDGLVAMWDGIENAGWGTHDESATTWKDLLGLTPLSFETPSAITVLPAAMRVDYDLNNDLRALSGRVGFAETAQTVEFCVTVDSGFSVNQNIFLGPYSVNGRNVFCAVVLNNNRGFLFNDGAMYGPNASAIGSATIAWTGSAAYKNAGTLGAAGSNHSTLTRDGYICIGAGLAQKYNIHSLRLYSRAMTADEIAANYAVDKARFNLP